MKNRILFHDPRLVSVAGGGEVLTLRKIHALGSEQYDITVLTREGVPSALFRWFLDAHPHVKIVTLAPRRDCETEADGHPWGVDLVADDAVRFSAVARDYYRTAQYDLVSVSFLPDLFGLHEMRNLVFHVYGLPPADMVAAQSPLLRNIRKMSAVSSFVKLEFCAMFARVVSASSVEVLHPGLEASFFGELSNGARPVDFLFVGRLVRRKGVDVIISALQRLREHYSIAPRVVIAGDGPERAALESLCRELRLDAQVVFLGAVDVAGVIRLLDQAKWFLYPVRRPEAFGLAPLEAMARGVPPILGALGGMADYLEHDRNGFALPEVTDTVLADWMRRALLDENRRQTFAAKGVQTAKRFSWDGFAERVNCFFEQAIN
jgi:glycosyltransferase involved in cell wall biosynthesis